MKTLPAYLRKPSNFKAGSLDDTTQDYQPLLATWLIEMALSMKWYRMPRPHRLAEMFGDDDFLSVTEITPPAEQDEDGEDESLALVEFHDRSGEADGGRTDASVGRHRACRNCMRLSEGRWQGAPLLRQWGSCPSESPQ